LGGGGGKWVLRPLPTHYTLNPREAPQALRSQDEDYMGIKCLHRVLKYVYDIKKGLYRFGEKWFLRASMRMRDVETGAYSNEIVCRGTPLSNHRTGFD
jgi:hypothetical protein